MKQVATRIDSLHLTNYRRFEDLQIGFDPELTVLVAANGGGKTAILDALVTLWGSFLGALEVDSRALRLSRDDVRYVLGPESTMDFALPAKLEATGFVAGNAVSWGAARTSVLPKAKVIAPGWDHLEHIAMQLRTQVLNYSERRSAESPILPLLCYYGTGRLWNTAKVSPGKKAQQADTSRFSGYTDCLSPASSFQFFESWFRRFTYEAESEINSGRVSPHKPRERLQAVRAAVGRLLAPSGWEGLEWDFAEDRLVGSHPEHGLLPVRLLSDGIRNMIGLVGDIAHRAVRLNPHLGEEAARKTPGVVLIDEVDMHLHPAWQQTVIESLRDAFPALQLVVTTHSHLVISTVPARCVRVLSGEGRAWTPGVEIQGYDSPFALATIFGVNSMPPTFAAEQLTEYRTLLELGRGDSEEAKALRTWLLAHFGEKHPAILAADGLRRLQEFKARIWATREDH